MRNMIVIISHIFNAVYTLEDLKWDAFQASHLIFKGNVAYK